MPLWPTRGGEASGVRDTRGRRPRIPPGSDEFLLEAGHRPISFPGAGRGFSACPIDGGLPLVDPRLELRLAGLEHAQFLLVAVTHGLRAAGFQ